MKDLGMWCAVLAVVFVCFLYWVSRKLGVDFNVAAQVVGGAVLVLGGAAALAWLGSNDRSYSWIPWQFFLPVLWAASVWPLLRAKGSKLPEFMFDRGFEPEYEWFAQGWFLWGGLIVLVALAAWWWWSDRNN